MDERFLEDIVSGIDDKYINETASALYENESRNVTSSDDLVIVEKKNKNFPFALVSAAALEIGVISVVVGVLIANEQNFSQGVTSNSSQTTSESNEIITPESTFTEDKEKPYTPIGFPSSPLDNEATAYHKLANGTVINAENLNKWLPYAYKADYYAPDWYVVKNEKNQMILKCGKRPTVDDVDGVYGPEADICIGDDSLKNYSLEIKFRFAEGEKLNFSLYESTLRSEANIPDANYTLDMCFMLTDDGKLYKWTPRYEELIAELGELDKNKWHTLTIDNIDGSLQLILNNEKKGEIYKVTTNEYGSFGFGGYNGVEIMSIIIDNVELNTDVENTESDENSTPETTLPESDENSTPETTLPDNDDKPVSTITFPSSSHTNDITAYQVITDGMKLNVENIDLWLPYADNIGSGYLEWYITENENGENIIKSGKCPQIMPPTGGNLSPEIYIGDNSLKIYSLLVDFRFGNVDTIKIGLYKDTFTTESDFATDEPMLGWFELDSDGKLYRTGVFSTPELITDIGEIDKDSYHTIQIENKGGSLQLIFDEKNYGEIAKVNDNQYGAFGIGGFELEVREMAVYDIEKYDAPIFDFSHLPQKLQSEFLKAEIGTDIKDRERIGHISAFVTGDASLLPEDTDEDVRKVFEEIYSTIVIKDYFIDVADDSLHFIASYQGQSIVKPYDEYAIYDFDKPAVNLTHDDRYTGGSYVDYITDNTHSSNADVEFEIIRVNYSLDGRTTENVARIFKKGDRLHITEEYIHVYTFTQSGSCGTEPSGPPSILSSEEFWQTKIESDLGYDYLGSTELTLSAEEVIYAYQKYLNEQNWELLNVLWYGNEMKWCGSKGDAESMFSDMKITDCKNVTEEEYADRFNIGINELIYHITYESDSKGEGSMFIRLKKDGANYYIVESFTG